MANDKSFKVKNGLSAKRYLQSGSALAASDVDVSSGSYFTKTLTANTTLTFSNPPPSGSASSFALEITGADVTVNYDLVNAAYDNADFSVSSQDTSPRGVRFNNDGTKMYVSGTTNDRVYQYSLSTGFDLSTASYDSVNFSISQLVGITFNNDGTKMYARGSGIQQYSLSTAFDLSTASSDSVSLNVSTEDTDPRAIVFNNDGTKLYVAGKTNDSVFQYSLSTAFDLSTASYDSVSFSVNSQQTALEGIAFNGDGTKLFITGLTSLTLDNIHQYSLSTAFDLSTASYDGVGFDSLVPSSTNPTDLVFSSDGAKMYVIFISGSPARHIYQYSTSASTPATVTYPSSVKWSGATTPDAPAAGEKDLYVFVTTDGGTTYYGKQAGDALA